jgi:hypothetical protein
MRRLFFMLVIISTLLSCKSESEILFNKYLGRVVPSTEFSDNAIIHVINLKGCSDCIDYQLKLLNEISSSRYYLILVGNPQSETQKSLLKTLSLPIEYDMRGEIKNYFFDFTNAIILSKATSQIIKIENEEDFHNFIYPFIGK